MGVLIGMLLAGDAVVQVSQVEDVSMMEKCMWVATQAVTEQK